jgi:hypothetical protein
MSAPGASCMRAGWRVALLLALGRAELVSAEQPPPRAAETLASCGSGKASLEVVMVGLERASEGGQTLELARAMPALRSAVCDWFREDAWQVRFGSQASAPEPAQPMSARSLRITLELPSNQLARLVADTGRGRGVHDVALSAGLDDAGVEAIAEALHSVAQAASAEAVPPVSGAAVARSSRGSGSTPPPARESAAPAAAPPPGDRASSQAVPSSAAGELAKGALPRVQGKHYPVHTGLGYQAYARGPEPLMHGPALHIEMDALSAGVTLGAYVRAHLFSSGARREAGFDVRSSGASLSVGAAASVALAPITARAGLGAGLDLVALDVRVSDPALARLLPEHEAAPRPFIGGELGVRYRFGGFELGLDALLRLLLFETRYEALEAARTVTLFRPWQLQPGGLIELAYVW